MLNQEPFGIQSSSRQGEIAPFSIGRRLPLPFSSPDLSVYSLAFLDWKLFVRCFFLRFRWSTAVRLEKITTCNILLGVEGWEKTRKPTEQQLSLVRQCILCAYLLCHTPYQQQYCLDILFVSSTKRQESPFLSSYSQPTNDMGQTSKLSASMGKHPYSTILFLYIYASYFVAIN